ncbi:transposase [Sedimentitalea sp. HM32M-2]|uniref:IS110 family transposase n=1 Tax=Sedimentitalea sp. HM32M-2 TaxID=3351566 RepID=UPI003645EC7A
MFGDRARIDPNARGERVKTDRLDALRLARLFRARELTPIWVPDEPREAMRDLVRARESAAKDRASSNPRFCCATAGFITAPNHGRCGTYDVSNARASTIPRTKSPVRKCRRPNETPTNGWAV